jgi:hypothetical protein
MFVYGTFEEEKDAAGAVRSLMKSGFDVRYVSALMRTGSDVNEVPVSVESGVRRGAVLGAAFGAAGGALLATGPGFLAAGPLLGILEAALGGGAAGVVPGGFLGLLFADAKVEFGEGELDADTILIGVNADTRPELARDIFAKCNARQVEITDHDASLGS